MNLTGFRAQIDGVIALTETAPMPQARRDAACIAAAASREGTSDSASIEVRLTGHGLAARIEALRLAADLTGTTAKASPSDNNDEAVYTLTGSTHALDYAAELYRLFDTQLDWSAGALGADLNPPEVLEGYLPQALQSWIAQTRSELAAYIPAATGQQFEEETMTTDTHTHWHTIMLEQITQQGIHPMVSPSIDTRAEAHAEIQTNLDRLAAEHSEAAGVADQWRENTTPSPGQDEPLINWEIFGWTLLECDQATCRDSVQKLLDTIAAKVTQYTGQPLHVPQLPEDWPDGATDDVASQTHRAETPDATIQRLFSSVIHPGRIYPHELPADLAPWYVYTIDGGHNIVIAIKSRHNAEGDPEDYLVPVSVRTVQRLGWTTDAHGHLICDVDYDPQLGVIVPEDDDEF